MRIKEQKNWITIIHYYGQHQVEHMVVIQWLYVGISTIQKHQVGGVTSYKLFYELRDGHSTDPRFYDISGHVGFSAIIYLD